MKKTPLETIQLISNIARIISKIFFIFSIITLVFSAIALVSLFMGIDEIIIKGATIRSIICANIEAGMASVYASVIVVILFSVSTIILSRFNMLYFEHELKEGTPFTLSGALELKRLGILTIVIPLIAVILSSITTSIIAVIMGEEVALELDCDGQVTLGIMYLIVSLLCRYGSEKR